MHCYTLGVCKIKHRDGFASPQTVYNFTMIVGSWVSTLLVVVTILVSYGINTVWEKIVLSFRFAFLVNATIMLQSSRQTQKVPLDVVYSLLYAIWVQSRIQRYSRRLSLEYSFIDLIHVLGSDVLCLV